MTLLDFILKNEGKLKGGTEGEKDSAAEAIENNIRRQVVEKVVINPAYYSKMSQILEQLILERKKKVISYKELIEKYIELAKNVSEPQNNKKYPENIRTSAAMRAFYDNCGENEELAVKLHEAVLMAKQEGFRNNPVKEKKIKKAIFKVLNNTEEVEKIYKLVVEQEEY